MADKVLCAVSCNYKYITSIKMTRGHFFKKNGHFMLCWTLWSVMFCTFILLCENDSTTDV